MKAMILAAGRGQRMRPLTDHTPKPLLPVNGKPLMVYHLEKLAALGVQDVVVNYAHLGEQFPATLGDGSRWGLRLHYSPEPTGGLETAGGIIQALPMLGEEPFWVINGDIWTDFDFAELPQELGQGDLAQLLVTDNPAHHPQGDFVLADGRLSMAETGQRFTYTGVGLYHPQFFADYQPAANAADALVLPLKPLLLKALAEQKLAGTYWAGAWTDVGTPARLAELEHTQARRTNT